MGMEGQIYIKREDGKKMVKKKKIQRGVKDRGKRKERQKKVRRGGRKRRRRRRKVGI